MLLLLPPSEGKTAPTGGAPVDPSALVHPGLTAQRLAVLDALAEVSTHPDAARVLGTGPSLAGEVERNARLRSEPAAPWGLVAPDDRIPAYRLSMGVDLPGVGPLARAWRPLLAAELDPDVAGRLVVDCRSAAYAAAWKPPATAEWVTVRVLREVDGRRGVVSHHAKHTRGVLSRHLLGRVGEPATPGELLAAARALVGGPLVDAELTDGGRARVLTLTVG